MPTTGHSPYCASKAGVVALTQVAALELAPRQVTVNAIAPGPVDTNLTAPLFAMAGAREEFLRHIPLGRVGRAEDIAPMILFLASDAAEWVTGQCFYYNLDRDAFELTNVAGNSANAALIALMAARLRELDPGWTGSAPSAPASAAPPDYANDDAFE